MNADRLLALFHVCIGWHGGMSSPLYRLQSKIFPRLIQPCRSEEYLVTLDSDGYEEARELYGKYAVALGGCKEGATYMPCACDGCEDDNIIGENWEHGLLRCDACRENDCGYRGCDCPREEDDSEEEEESSK